MSRAAEEKVRRSLTGTISGYWPTVNMTPLTRELWTKELWAYEVQDVEKGIRLAAQEVPFINLADLLVRVRRVRDRRIAKEQQEREAALAHALMEGSEAQRERAHKILSGAVVACTLDLDDQQAPNLRAVEDS